QVFIGLENINPDNLKHARKGQNKITEYRQMLQAWRKVGVFTYCGYILGFPDDTPQSIERDIEIIKRELPVDILEFFILTPLPGSQDHQRLHNQGVWMDPDMNKYDLEHVTTAHQRMSTQELESIYRRAWDLYYTREHIETLVKRAIACGMQSSKLTWLLLAFPGSVWFDKVHPLQSGFFRRKVRTQRRSDMPLENRLLFYPRRAIEIVRTMARYYRYLQWLRRLNKRLVADPATSDYTDIAIRPVEQADVESLDMFQATRGADLAVAKARRMANILDEAGAGKKQNARAPSRAVS
ncbi:MAG: radical SAM protein, partial [Gammaproteobacteria bacterium]|nr:radical SAM protein [Gammaproteobacteria bacterium]